MQRKQCSFIPLCPSRVTDVSRLSAHEQLLFACCHNKKVPKVENTHLYGATHGQLLEATRVSQFLGQHIYCRQLWPVIETFQIGAAHEQDFAEANQPIFYLSLP